MRHYVIYETNVGILVSKVLDIETELYSFGDISTRGADVCLHIASTKEYGSMGPYYTRHKHKHPIEIKSIYEIRVVS